MPDKKLFEITDEASKHARRIYYLYIGFLTYCALTVVSTKDRQLAITGEDVRLPIVDIEVSLEGFFIVAPIICILLFVFYRLYSHKLHSLISQLTGEPEKLYSWMVNMEYKPDSGIIGKFQSMTVSLTTWYMLPLVLFLFGFWYFKKHDPVMSWVIGAAVPIIGTAITIWFWNVSDLQGHKINWRGLSGWVIITLFLNFIILSLIFIPSVNDGYFKITNLDLSYQVLVEIPEKEKGFENIYWVNLRGANLQGANLESSVLQRADLRGANLKEANLRKADMKEADFKGADLRKANLNKANLFKADMNKDGEKITNLQGADLSFADLQEAVLSFADLQGADLRGADLQGADLSFADHRGADLLGANLRGAILLGADLQGAVLSFAELQGADISFANLQGADLSFVDLLGADLRGANLQGADLRGADLQGGVLRGAKLQGADLRGADLQGGVLISARLTNLLKKIDKVGNVIQETKVTAENLCEALTLYNDGTGEPLFELKLEKMLKKQCPKKLKKPDWNKHYEDHKKLLIELLGELPVWAKNWYGE